MCRGLLFLLLVCIVLYPVKTVGVITEIKMQIVDVFADAGSDFAKEIRSRGIIVENDYLQHKEMN